jgi:hypothetical protein
MVHIEKHSVVEVVQSIARRSDSGSLRERRRMRMLGLDESQRSLLADKISDVGNLTAGALVLGQFVGGVPVSTSLVAVGIASWFVLMGAAVRLKQPESGR